jgi:hypothetical protein
VASLLQKSEFDFLEDMFRKAFKHLIDQMSDLGLSNDDLLRLVKKVIDLSCVIDLRSDFLAVAKESFYRNADWISDVSCLVEFLELCPKVSGPEDKDRVVQTIDDIVDNLDDNDPQLLSDELSSLEEIERKSGLSLQKQIESVRCLLSRAEENCPPEEDYDNDRYRGSSTSGQSIGNDALADMFSTLLR